MKNPHDVYENQIYSQCLTIHRNEAKATIENPARTKSYSKLVFNIAAAL